MRQRRSRRQDETILHGKDKTPDALRRPRAAPGDPTYYQKLTNLFPAEALAIYGTGTAIFGSANIVVVAVGAVILLVFRTIANQETHGARVDWPAVAVALLSYLFWATANDSHWMATFDPRLAAMAKAISQYAAFFGAALVFLAPVLAPVPEHKPA